VCPAGVKRGKELLFALYFIKSTFIRVYPPPIPNVSGGGWYDHLMVQFSTWKTGMTDPIKKSSQPEKSRAASSSLQGYPGYRTRAGRSGLDPVDNDAEGGHMAGVFIRRLLTGKLRTRNPFALLLLALLGLACTAPLLLAVLEAMRGDLLPFGAWVLITISFLFGVLLLFNLVRALLH
jgi:hypothetical protein